MRRIAVLLIVSALLVASLPGLAQQRQKRPQQQEADSKAGEYYLGVTGSHFRHKKLSDGNGKATVTTTGVVFGKFLNDHVKVEARGGAAPSPEEETANLELDIDYYASAYIGVYYHWTMFSRAYAQFGMSHVETTATRTSEDDDGNVTVTEDSYLETSLSRSWLVGTDVDFIGNSSVFVEYGQLHQDTTSHIRIRQWNLGLRLDF
ncbi:outer membrane beta-barrel protein [Salicola sp. Rm-C-2C1-2]|uniref:outer membrane beta-barrel protein n=1 Tax=Salicola sp. Rm-C-2C1-2 TaxID=3141321 RepID=UPI0032E4F1EC